MAANDLKVVNYGPSSGSRWFAQEFRLDAAATFVEGEPVAVAASGELQEAGDDPDGEEFAGIALHSGDTVGDTNGIGIFRRTIGQAQAAASPNLPQTGDPIMVAIPLPGATVSSENFATDGAGTSATPALANIGDLAGLTLTSGNWFIDTGTTNNLFRIVDVLDDNGESLQRNTSGTGVTVVATVLNSQFSNSETAPVAD